LNGIYIVYRNKNSGPGTFSAISCKANNQKPRYAEQVYERRSNTKGIALPMADFLDSSSWLYNGLFSPALSGRGSR
jgi:hypothetical protein